MDIYPEYLATDCTNFVSDPVEVPSGSQWKSCYEKAISHAAQGQGLWIRLIRQLWHSHGFYLVYFFHISTFNALPAKKKPLKIFLKEITWKEQGNTERAN